MNDNSFPEFFPHRQVFIYLMDMKERERIIKENLMMISMSREYIEKVLKSSETSDNE
jgi:hypothetical protein